MFWGDVGRVKAFFPNGNPPRWKCSLVIMLSRYIYSSSPTYTKALHTLCLTQTRAWAHNLWIMNRKFHASEMLTLATAPLPYPPPTGHKCKPLVDEWSEQASQWHEMYYHDLKVMSLNPDWVEFRMRSTSV